MPIMALAPQGHGNTLTRAWKHTDTGGHIMGTGAQRAQAHQGAQSHLGQGNNKGTLCTEDQPGHGHITGTRPQRAQAI